jgi:hypothetical protein
VETTLPASRYNAGKLGFAAESIELIIDDQAFSPSPLPVSKLSLFLSHPVSPVELTAGRGGDWAGKKLDYTMARKPGLL